MDVTVLLAIICILWCLCQFRKYQEPSVQNAVCSSFISCLAYNTQLIATSTAMTCILYVHCVDIWHTKIKVASMFTLLQNKLSVLFLSRRMGNVEWQRLCHQSGIFAHFVFLPRLRLFGILVTCCMFACARLKTEICN